MSSMLQSLSGFRPWFSFPTERTSSTVSVTKGKGEARAEYSSRDVVAVSKVHPFYTSDIKYPPDVDTIETVRKAASQDHDGHQLEDQPLLWKSRLYQSIERLTNDFGPQNTFRRGVYVSITGGGSGSIPLVFATDAQENRRHRAYFGQFIRTLGVIEDGDWVVTTHSSGHLYR
jgi:hypothetical protein